MARNAKLIPSTRWSLVANYAGQAWSAAANIIFVPLYIRYLGIEAYGLVGIFTILVASMSLIDSVMGPTVNREMALVSSRAVDVRNAGDLLRSLECVCSAFMVLVPLAISLVAKYIAAGWLHENSLSLQTVARALVFMSACASLRLAEGLYRGVLLGLHCHLKLNLVSVLVATVRAAGAVIVLKKISPTIDAFFAWQMLVSVLSVGFFGLVSYLSINSLNRAKFRFSLSALTKVRKFAAGVLVTSAIGLVLTQIDKVMLSRAVALEQFGFYALAVTVGSTLYQLIGPATQSYYPRFTALLASNDVKKLATTYHRACQLSTLAVVPAALVLYFDAYPLLLVWSRDAKVAAGVAPILSILSLGTMLHCLTYMPYMLQLANGWSGLGAKSNLVALCVLLPALLWTIPRYGPIGAAYLWMLLNLGYVLISIPVMHSVLLRGEVRYWYVFDTVLPVLAGIASALAAERLGSLFGSHDSHYLHIATTAIFVGLAVTLTLPLGREAIVAVLSRITRVAA